MTELKAGQKAPFFEGTDQNDNKISLDDFKGRKLVLYFYPKDNTPGCTDEACNLRDNYNDLIKKGFTVLGISPDSEKSHQKFASKHNLPFPLISDTEKKIMSDYGTWGEKKMYGKKFMGVLRTTFIINEEGIIEEVIKKVDTKKHTEQIYKLYE